jgi:hypothetical protein
MHFGAPAFGDFESRRRYFLGVESFREKVGNALGNSLAGCDSDDVG